MYVLKEHVRSRNWWWWTYSPEGWVCR